jgi:hypothetical protein
MIGNALEEDAPHRLAGPLFQRPDIGGPANLQISPGRALQGGFSFSFRAFLKRTRINGGPD